MSQCQDLKSTATEFALELKSVVYMVISALAASKRIGVNARGLQKLLPHH
jgi:hypothetical protein